MTGVPGAGAGPGKAGSARAAGAPAYGLVHSPTSDTQTMQLDRIGVRLARLRKNVLTSARLLRDGLTENGFRTFLALLTVTYAPGAKWDPYHITELQKRIRMWLGRRGHRYSYVWVCELQKRGAPHYHILIWLPHGVWLPKPDRMGWWPHGSSNIQGVEKPLGYLVKYLSKCDVGKFAKGQRIHGSGGLEGTARQERRWWLSPSYVRKRWPEWSADVRPAGGGGWLSRQTGEWMASPWRFVKMTALGPMIKWVAGPRIGVFESGDESCA